MLPHALFPSPVRVYENAAAMLLVVLILALVGAAVRQLEHSHSVHLVVLPLPVVGRSVGPSEETLAVLLAVSILPLVATAVRPALLSVALLPVFDPVPLVVSSCPTCVEVVPPPVRFALQPLTLVGVAVCQNEATVARGLPIPPKPNVLRAIGPDLHSEAFFAVRLKIELTSVDSAILNCKPDSKFKLSSHRVPGVFQELFKSIPQ